MAKVKYTAIVADMRGKLNGSVFSKNRGGAYVRTKVTPSNPSTTYQNQVRDRLATFAQAFRALTAAQIAAWNSAVSSFTKTDIFGDIKSPSGINLYVKLNANLDRVSVADISIPPLPAAVENVLTGSAVLDVSDQSVTVTFTPTPVPAGTAFVIRATKQVSPGRSFLKNLLTDIQVVDAAGTSPVVITTNYLAKYGTIVLGQKVGFEIVPINKVTGQAGVGIRFNALATA
jgi:hypothetical protein